MGCKYTITISRQFGSGGKEIGKALADKLGIDFYDKELISLAAKESGYDPKIFENVDERATNSLLYSLSMGLYSFGNGFSSMGDLPVNDQLYMLQHKIIKKLANEKPCIFVGRCADYVLKDNPKCINIFLYADLDYRVKRTIERNGVDPDRAEQAVNKADKTRANYYSFYSGKKWGRPENYHLCINTGILTTNQCVDIITNYIENLEKQ
ncbi:MAG: cytidylate kinase-like family protein [bacterium]|nr:cytidylate kinase-like family protein [bacterium]MDD6224807.1 cytidylate kinase-like family protein [bacterium]MDY3862314.1 cytidylate kinase-like family protein [Ruminococcus sp.]